jgi:hypothetical protein
MPQAHPKPNSSLYYQKIGEQNFAFRYSHYKGHVTIQNVYIAGDTNRRDLLAIMDKEKLREVQEKICFERVTGEI